MNIKNYLLIIVLMYIYITGHSQEISSGKSAVHINTKTTVKKGTADNIPPSVLIISPDLKDNNTILHEEMEFNVLGKAEDEGGISSVFINTEELDFNEEGVFVYKTLLDRGENRFSVIVLDNNNNVTKKNFTVEYNGGKLVDDNKIYSEGTYYALLIGVNKYDDPEINDLDNPLRDAKEMYDALIKNYTFKKENIELIKNAKRIDIINALDVLSNKVTSKDNLLIFFAGHGYWDEKASIGYWLPSDAQRSSKGAWFRNSTLCDYLKEINSKHTLLIADACFAGGIFKTRDAFSDASKAIRKLYELPSRKAMTSGTLTKVPDRSAFVKYLIDRLYTNTEKYLSSEQLFSSFRIAVINNSDVVPQYGEIRAVGDEGGDFIFIRR